MSSSTKAPRLRKLHSHIYPSMGEAAVAAGACLDIVYLFGSWFSVESIRTAFKPLLVPIITLTYLAHTSSPDKYVILAQVFGWLGDVFLLGQGSAFFLLGLVTFLIGHVFYIVAFCMRYAKRPRSPHDLYVAFTFPFMVVGSRYLLSLVPRNFTFPVCLYGAVIISMTLSGHLLACDLWRFDADLIEYKEFEEVKTRRDRTTSWKPHSYRMWSVLLRIGTYLFLMSDFVLGVSIFGGKIP